MQNVFHCVTVTHQLILLPHLLQITKPQMLMNPGPKAQEISFQEFKTSLLARGQVGCHVSSCRHACFANVLQHIDSKFTAAAGARPGGLLRHVYAGMQCHCVSQRSDSTSSAAATLQMQLHRSLVLLATALCCLTLPSTHSVTGRK